LASFVVFDPHGPAQGGAQVSVDGPADEPGRIGVLDQSAGWRQGPGNADPDTPLTAQLALQAVDQIRYHGDRAVVVAARGDLPPPGQDFTLFAQGDGLDLGAAEINADPHPTP
jgi:hypothetical protein